MFFARAYAAPGGQGGTDILMSMLPFILIFGVLYFLMIRPQQKRAEAHKKSLAAMKRGDRVVTNSGVIGTIVKVKDSEFVLEVADDVEILVVKDAIAALYTPRAATPAAAPADENASKNAAIEKPKKSKATSSKAKK